MASVRYVSLVLVLGAIAVQPRVVASNTIVVPNDEPTIDGAIHAVENGDTILVLAGTYTGDGNCDLDLLGKDIIIVAPSGPGLTVIDCQQAFRAFNIQNGEPATTQVIGFSIVDGDPSVVGTAISVTNSDVSFRGCVIRDHTSNTTVIYVDAGNPTFEDCFFETNTANGSGTVMWVNSGNPSFVDCIFDENTADETLLHFDGGSPAMVTSTIRDNVAGDVMLSVRTTASLITVEVDGNTGNGMKFWSTVGPSWVENCLVNANSGTGIVVEDESWFLDCGVTSNGLGGVVVIKPPFAFSPGADGRASTRTVNAPIFSSCTIAGNVNPSVSGGGVRIEAGTPVLTFQPEFENCTITGNSSGIHGGGVAILGNAVSADIVPYFTNCTVSFNNAGGTGGGVYMGANVGGAVALAALDLTILWGNCAMMGDQSFGEQNNEVFFNCSDVDSAGPSGPGKVTYGETMAFEDPLFCEPPSCAPQGTIDGNFSVDLLSVAAPGNSPCGQQIGSHPPQCAPTGIDDDAPAVSETVLLPNVPNPFNPTTRIRFDLAVPSNVSLKIFDVTGRLVRTLVDEPMSAALHEVVWDGTDDRGARVGSGVYFSRISTGQVVQTRKMVLLK
jgi:hypothetical protein